MNQLAKKTAAFGFLVFLALWVTGIIRGADLPYPQPTTYPLLISEPSAQQALLSSNIANNLKQVGLAGKPLLMVLDESDISKIVVFEKRGVLTLGTTSFSEDEKAIRQAMTDVNAVVFNEKKSGIEPARELTIELGVHPEQFETLLEQLRKIGDLRSLEVQQQDRTSEFRRLHAQRQALQKYLDSVLKLRSAGKGSLDDSLKLEQKIQEIQKELQNLGVQLGDLLGKESFYQIRVTLVEYLPGSRLDKTYSAPKRVFNGFVWAIGWFLASALAVGVSVGTLLSLSTLGFKGPGQIWGKRPVVPST